MERYEKVITPEIEERLISWCEIEKYSQGDSYFAYVSQDNKFCVGYTNDYPLQHGKGKCFTLSDTEFEYAMNRPLTELELMQKFWWPKTMLERQDLCDKYFEGEVARCLNENKRIHIYKQETLN